MEKLDELLAKANDTLTVNRVYGEPIQSNGVTLIPAASVRGGVGSGEGESTEPGPGGSGSGGGMGISARPVGAYQIRGDEVKWVPAADVTRVIMMSQVVAIVALMVVRSILRLRRARD